MLILSRREGEAVVIGDDVTIVILGIKGRHVRVGIAAPKSTNIYREEILSRLEPDDDRAAQPEALRTAHLRSQVRGQAYRRQQLESAGSANHETSTSQVRAIAKALDER